MPVPESRRPRPYGVVAAHGFAALAVASYLVIGIAAGNQETRIVWESFATVSIILAGLSIALSRPWAERGLARWRLGPWFLTWSALSYGVASLTWRGPQRGYAGVIDPASVETALLVIDLAMVCWVVGYLSNVMSAVGRGIVSPVRALLRPTAGAALRGNVATRLFIFGTAAHLAPAILNGHFDYLGDPAQTLAHANWYAQALNSLSEFAAFGIAVAAWQVFTGQSRRRRSLWIMLAIQIVLAILGGNKGPFVFATLAVLVPYSVTRGRMPIRWLVTVGLVFVFVLFPFITGYRTAVRSDSLTPTQAVTAAPGQFTQTVVINSATITWSTTTFLKRTREVDNVAVIVQKTPGLIPYRSLSEVFTIAAAELVPRVFWPNKPIFTPGYEMCQEYFGMPAKVLTSCASTPIGDLYRRGGLLIVAAGMFLFGTLIRVLDNMLRPEADPRALFFTIALVPLLVNAEHDATNTILGVFVASVGAIVAIRLAFRADRRDCR